MNVNHRSPLTVVFNRALCNVNVLTRDRYRVANPVFNRALCNVN